MLGFYSLTTCWMKVSSLHPWLYRLSAIFVEYGALAVHFVAKKHKYNFVIVRITIWWTSITKTLRQMSCTGESVIWKYSEAYCNLQIVWAKPLTGLYSVLKVYMTEWPVSSTVVLPYRPFTIGPTAFVVPYNNLFSFQAPAMSNAPIKRLNMSLADILQFLQVFLFHLQPFFHIITVCASDLCSYVWWYETTLHIIQCLLV